MSYSRTQHGDACGDRTQDLMIRSHRDLYKTYLWGICIILNLFVALTDASESIYDVINMAAI